MEVGDSTLNQGNDEYVEVSLPDGSSLPFYGNNYKKIFINTNGLITFGKAWPFPQTSQYFNTLPLHPDLNSDGVYENLTFAAPFWADVDTSRGRGIVYYQIADSSSYLRSAVDIVKKHFPMYPEYTPHHMIVATWVNVSFYNHDSSKSADPRNTFQAVLITDTTNSFVFFFYDKVLWTAGTTLLGNQHTGIPEKDVYQAIVGFNRGDGSESFEAGIPAQRMDLSFESNIGEFRSFAFQVNGGVICQAVRYYEETGCGDFSDVQYGSINITMNTDCSLVALVTCDDGFILLGTGVYECANSTWSHGTSECKEIVNANEAAATGILSGLFIITVLIVAVI